MDRLTFALLSDSLAEVRRVRARCGRDSDLGIEDLQRHFSVWERGVLLNAAFFLLDFPRVAIEIPCPAITTAHRLVQLEARHGYLEELVAASMGAAPWRGDFPGECLRCGRPGSWRPVLSAPGLPPELAWRYARPENHITLCRRCASRLTFRKWEVRFELVRGLWGPRFTALLRWHHARESGVLPADWDRGAHPLWPQPFGGRSWARGSGALEFSEPRPYWGVRRSHADRERLARYLGAARAASVLAARPEPPIEISLPACDYAGGQTVGAAR